MSQMTCEEVREILPNRLQEALAPEREEGVVEHLASCPRCQGELALLQSIRAVRPSVPAGLEEAITRRLRSELGSREAEGDSARTGVVPLVSRRRSGTPLWTLSAAAMVVLALGTGIIWNRWTGNGTQEPPQVAAQEVAPEAWLWDDGLVAGGPVFDGLSEEALETLLEELGG